jgi:hypothetical protein
MKKGGFIAVFAVALLIAPAMMAQSATCTAVTPANSAFNAALLGSGISGASGSPNGFANVSLSLNGNTATVTASSLGLNNINGISLFEGQPGSPSAMLVQTFSTSTNNFQNGQFSTTMTLSPTLISQIQATPGNFFFVVTTPDFPNGAVAGALLPTSQQLIGGVAPAIVGSTQTGAFLINVGPSNGAATVPLTFDITVPNLAGTVNSVQLFQSGGITPLMTIGTNLTPVNGRIVGTTQIDATLARQILANPCSFTLSFNGVQFPNGQAIAAIAASNEVFLPVVGSVAGANGTNFMTDISIFNNSPIGVAASSAIANAFVQFFPSGNTPSSSTLISAQNVSALNIPARGTTTLRDVNNSIFGGAINGIGALRITSSSNILANARIYNNQIANGRGTFGQFEPGMFRSQALQQGVLVGVGNITGGTAANGQSFHTNVGFFNPNPTATTVALEMRDTNGNAVATQTITLQPFGQLQEPLDGSTGLFSSLNGDTGSSSVFFLSGSPIFAYASVVDNISGDASFVTPSATPINPGNTTGQ